ncbi:MAG: hypothetical protein AAGC95_01510 [Pseudomonadota bacterium]
MSGIEGNNAAGGSQTTESEPAAAKPAQRRAVSSAEADQFSSSLKPAAGAPAQSGQTGQPTPANSSATGTGALPGGSAQPGQGAQPGPAGQAAPTQTSTLGAGAQPGALTLPGQTAAGPAQLQSLGQNKDGGDSGLVNQLSTSGMAAAQLAGGAAETVAATPAPRESLGDLADKLANRILASKPDSGGAEVRIELSMNKLQGAVITMRQDANGLSVIFDAPSPEVAARLAETRGDLVQRLQHATGENVSVDINEHDADRDGQPEDGRSRNQYEAEAEEEGDDA